MTLISLLAATAALLGSGLSEEPRAVRHVIETATVGTDPDDPAIWVNAANPEKSLILGTDKIELPGGALYVFDLAGKVVQKIENLDRPNNVDVEYGFNLGGKSVDIAVLTERKKHRLRIFTIDRLTGRLTDVTGKTQILKGETGEASEPMGIGLYRRPDGRVSAFVSPKTGPKHGYLAEVELIPNGDRVDAKQVRRLGQFSGEGEIESILVDDEMGFLYYSDEGAGVRKMTVDPANSKELAMLGRTGYNGDREGLAIYATGKGTGYLLSTDQIEGGSITKVYRREGSNQFVTELAGGADDTDGIDVTSLPLGPSFPHGLWVAMNSGPKTFLIYDGREIRRALGIR